MSKEEFILKKGLLVCLTLLCAFAAVSAQTKGTINYPTKAINLIVPWNPGDGTDIVARTYVQALKNYLSVPIVVLNKPGASGSIGTLYAAQRPADGYTVLFSAETPGTFEVMGIGNVSFSAFDGIIMMVEDTKAIVVKGNSPYKTLGDLISAIKANPGKIKMAYSGPGASGHIQGLLLKKMGFETSMTPFGGGSAGMTAVMGGQVDFTFANLTTTFGYLDSGDLRALAVFTDKRAKRLPDVPAFTEVVSDSKKYLPLGFPNCVLVPAGTPQHVKDILIEASKKAIQDPVWTEFLAARAYNTLHEITGDAVNEYWKDWSSRVCWLLHDAGVTKDSPEKFGIPRK